MIIKTTANVGSKSRKMNASHKIISSLATIITKFTVVHPLLTTIMMTIDAKIMKLVDASPYRLYLIANNLIKDRFLLWQ